MERPQAEADQVSQCEDWKPSQLCYERQCYGWFKYHPVTNGVSGEPHLKTCPHGFDVGGTFRQQPDKMGLPGGKLFWDNSGAFRSKGHVTCLVLSIVGGAWLLLLF